jgi:hypothetical protein
MVSTFRSRLTYANVMVTILAFIVLSGGSALAASVIITSNSQVAAHTIAGATAASGINKNIIPGSLGGSDLAAGTVTAANVAAANKDGTAGTPSLRTLGTGAQQAAAGNDPRLAKGVVGAQILSFNGPMPTTTRTFTVTKTGDLLLITWSGTAWRSSAQGPGGGFLVPFIDGTNSGTSTFLYINNPGEHMTFPTQETVASLSAGTHTISFNGAFLTSDENDTYYVTIVEVKPNP